MEVQRPNELSSHDYSRNLCRLPSVPDSVDKATRTLFSQEGKELSGRLGLERQILLNLLIAVCILVLAAHYPVLSAQALTIDDQQYLTANELVQNPSWESVRRFLTEVFGPTKRGYYQPLTMISLMGDCALGGREDDLTQFHRTSLALHVANTAFVVVLLYLLFGQAWMAAAAGLLFGVHPLTVEPVAWISERTTVLSSFFALSCLIVYIFYTRKRNWKLLAACVVIYILALASKPTSIMLPLLMLTIDYWPLGRSGRRVIREKLPFFITGGIFVFITIVSRSSNLDHPLQVPGGDYLKQVPVFICHNIIFYLYKIVWPANLTPLYPFPKPLNISEPIMLAGIIGTCVLIPLLITSLRRTRAIFTGCLFSFIAILPTLQVTKFSVSLAANKYVYLSSLGLLMILVSFLWRFCGGDRAGKQRARQVLAGIIVLLLAGAETVVARQYLVRWRDSAGLYEYMLTLAPGEDLLHYNLACLLGARGESDGAISHYREALRIDPDNGKAHNNLGLLFMDQGKLDEAISHYRQALQVAPGIAEAHNNLGAALESKGKLDEAISHYRQALRINPDMETAHSNMAYALLLQGKLDEAIEHCREALRINPDFLQAHSNMGEILEMQGKAAEAIEHYNKALNLGSNFVTPLNKLAWLRATNPDPEVRDANEAVTLAERAAILSKYKNVEVLDTLAAAYAAAGQFDAAVTTAQLALSAASDPNDNELADQIAERLELYRQAKPYRQDPSTKRNGQKKQMPRKNLVDSVMVEPKLLAGEELQPVGGTGGGGIRTPVP